MGTRARRTALPRARPCSRAERRHTSETRSRRSPPQSCYRSLVQADVNQLSEKIDLLVTRLRLAGAADKQIEGRLRTFRALTIVAAVLFVGACNVIVHDVVSIQESYQLPTLGALLVIS